MNKEEDMDFFKGIFEYASEGILVVDHQGKILIANPACERMFGYGTDELLGAKIETLVPQKSRTAHAGHIKNFAKQPKIQRMGMGLDIFGLRKDASHFPVEISLSPITLMGKKVVIAFVLDVTERLTAKQKLMNIEQRMVEAQDLAHVGSWYWNLRTNERTWSDEFFRICGFPPGDTRLNANTVADLIHPDDREASLHAASKAIKNKEPYNFEKRIVRPDGTIRHVMANGMAIYDAQGEPIEMLGNMQDITELKKKEDLLKEKERQILEYTNQLEQKVEARTRELTLSEARLLEGNKMAKIGNWILDLSTNEIIFSEALYEIYGLDPSIPITKEIFFGKIRFDDKEMIVKRIEAIDRGEMVDDIEFRIIDAKGIEKYLRAMDKYPILDDSGKKRISFGVTQDITDQKKTEQQLASALQKEKDLSELKSRIVSMASHEFRTPLSAILTSAQLIKRYGDKGIFDKQEKHIERIRSSVHNLTHILNDFLSLEKLESGKESFKPGPIAIDPYIRNILQEVRLWAGENQNILYQHTGPKEVHIDPYLVQNILLNLLSNALKYSLVGTDVSLITKNLDNTLQIQVIDYGIGIPENEQNNLFSRFFRASNATNIKGTGLGLTILKRYLDLMEGTISFKSTLGEGSTFTVVIPQLFNVSKKFTFC